MVAFLMLGIIPGTNIQISFETWLACMLALGVLWMVAIALRKRLPLILMIYLTIRRSTRNITPAARLA